jgi:phosphoglycerol transferase MdoB-like AlkP superfamily enzyme
MFAPGKLKRADFRRASRYMPAFDELSIKQNGKLTNHNIVIIVLEGVQYASTSFGDPNRDLTPFLSELAREGATFLGMRSTLTHTTKALFSLMTGRYPSISHDIVETIPPLKPYAGLATILQHSMNFRTAFLQSAKGTFEARPGLVSALGFDDFGAREDLCDPNAYVGSLGCDEFELLEPISRWVTAENGPFLLTIMCSVTHDPYIVPQWFGVSDKEPVERYRDTIAYTDGFLRQLDALLTQLNLRQNTIFCVVGDHGEAFGEHGFFGHERIVFEQVLHVPWVIRAPLLVKEGIRINGQVTSTDVTPTLLALLGFDVDSGHFDGINALSQVPPERRIYFSGWLNDGPAGYIENNVKFTHTPADRLVTIYDLASDPLELSPIEPNETQAEKIMNDIFAWKKETIIPLNREDSGNETVFERWHCTWNNRTCRAKYLAPEAK